MALQILSAPDEIIDTELRSLVSKLETMVAHFGNKFRDKSTGGLISERNRNKRTGVSVLLQVLLDGFCNKSRMMVVIDRIRCNDNLRALELLYSPVYLESLPQSDRLHI